jgi:hypothetical protein
MVASLFGSLGLRQLVSGFLDPKDTKFQRQFAVDAATMTGNVHDSIIISVLMDIR